MNFMCVHIHKMNLEKNNILFTVFPHTDKQNTHIHSNLKTHCCEFPGSPVVRTQHFHCQGLGSISGWGTKVPQAAGHTLPQKIKNKNTLMRITE